MSDKTIIITGCTAGLGIETARALHRTGAKLFLTVRDKGKGEAVIRDIAKTYKGKHAIGLLFMDLSSLSSVRLAAADFLSRSEKLNILIENAGVMFPAEFKTVDGFETHMGTNHFGHFLFFQLLKPTLLASSTPSFRSRVVTVSSSGHRISPIRFHDMDFAKEGYQKWLAYGQSKTANIYLANSIERRYGAQGLHAHAVHPGAIFTTELTRKTTEEDVAQIGSLGDFAKVEKSVAQGAATQVWAAISSSLVGKGGVYLSDIGEARLAVEDEMVGGPGHALHAYDEEAEEELWKISMEAVGLSEVD